MGGEIVSGGDEGFGTAWRWRSGTPVAVILDVVVDVIEVHEDESWGAHRPLIS